MQVNRKNKINSDTNGYHHYIELLFGVRIVNLQSIIGGVIYIRRDIAVAEGLRASTRYAVVLPR